MNDQKVEIGGIGKVTCKRNQVHRRMVPNTSRGASSAVPDKTCDCRNCFHAAVDSSLIRKSHILSTNSKSLGLPHHVHIFDNERRCHCYMSEPWLLTTLQRP